MCNLKYIYTKLPIDCQYKEGDQSQRSELEREKDQIKMDYIGNLPNAYLLERVYYSK